MLKKGKKYGDETQKSEKKDIEKMTESTARVCTWTRSTRAAVPSDPVDPDDEDMCCICLEAIDDAKQVVLRCAHKFHGQCLCDHLVHDARCPICRDHPYNDNSYESDEDDMSIDESPISFREAMRMAREARKTDKRVDAMFKTLKKWKKERKDQGCCVTRNMPPARVT